MSVYPKNYERIWQKIFKSENIELPRISQNLENAISNLPEENSIVIRLHFIENIPRKEIAKNLGWSLSKVNTKLTRGISLLRWQCNPLEFEFAKQLFARRIEKILTDKIV